MTCDHTYAYPAFMPTAGEKRVCRDCGQTYVRPHWLDEFSPIEVRDLQVWAAMIAVGCDWTESPETKQKLYAEGYQRHTALWHLHDWDHRLDEVKDMIRHVQRYLKQC